MHSWRDILIEWEAVWNQYLNDDRAFSRPLSPLSHPQPSSHAPSTSFPEHPQLNSRQIYLHTIPRCPHTTFHSSQVSRGCCGPELNAGRQTFTKSTEKTHVPCCCRIVGSFRLRRTMHISTRGQRGVGLWEKMLTYFPKPPHYIFKLSVDHAVSRNARASPATHWHRARLADAVCFYLLLYHHRILVGKLRENALYSPCQYCKFESHPGTAFTVNLGRGMVASYNLGNQNAILNLTKIQWITLE